MICRYSHLVFLLLAVLATNSLFAQTAFSSEQIISTSVADANGVIAVDIDLDGDNDVIATSSSSGNVFLFTNTGAGNFDSAKVVATISFPAWITAALIDGDSLPDLIIPSGTLNSLVWFRNLGFSNFSAPIIIAADATGAAHVQAGDIDNDGDMDLVGASIADPIAWYENLGGGLFASKKYVSTVLTADRVFIADVTGDGLVDVISASSFSDQVFVHRNQGASGFGPKRLVTDSLNFVSGVYADDFDADGDLDIVGSSIIQNKVVWHANLGGGLWGPENVISDIAFRARSVVTADFDLDGDPDVLSANIEDEVTWFENLGTGNFGPKNIINSSALAPLRAVAADLDNDGDLDVLSASTADNKIAWYENLFNECDTGIAPQNLDAFVGSELTLSWDPVPASIGCQIKGVELGGSAMTFSRKIAGSSITSWTVDSSVISPGQTWSWKVRCACQISPSLLATPFSTPQSFTIPIPKINANAPLVIPNPVDNLLNFPDLREIAHVKVFDTKGVCIFSKNVTQIQALNLNCELWADGFYIIQFETEIHSRFEKLILKN